MSSSDYNAFVEEAFAQDFSGWDFSWLRGRWYEEKPPWAYENIAREEITCVSSMLDMGTGGGEILASLAPLPRHTVATESYPPNIPVARSRLEPLGVDVVAFKKENALPLTDNQFELIINRHDSYAVLELLRLLKPGGRFLTQQVGGQDCIQINQFLGAPDAYGDELWTVENEIRKFENAGFQIERVQEALLDSHFYDIGAVVFFLKIIAWQIPDFTPQKYGERLQAMHRLIEQEGAFKAKAHRFLILARKPL